MKADPDTEGHRLEVVVDSCCRARPVRSSQKDDEERIAVGRHLDAVVFGDRSAHDPAVFVVQPGELVTELVREPRRCLDVGEAEHDFSLGKRRRHGAVIHRYPRPIPGP